MKKKTYLIPIALILLVLLVPIIYSATQQDKAPESPLENAVSEQDAEKNSANGVDEDHDGVEGEGQPEAVSDSKETPQQAPQKGANETGDKKNKGSSEQSKVSVQDNKQKPPSGGGSTPASKVEEGPQAGMIRVGVTVVDSGGAILNRSAKVDVKEKSTVLDALYASGVPSKIKANGYVEELCGLGENLRNGAGWMYTVNGGDPPGVGANSYTIKSGDQILWYYGKIGEKPPKM